MLNQKIETKKSLAVNYGWRFFFAVIFCMGLKTAIASENDMLFEGVTVQSHDFSCGAAALSTLITGIVENSHVSEENIIDAIADIKGSKNEDGYTATELAEASKRLGYDSEWRQVSPSFLEKIKQPVLLLIGLNSDSPHYVVLKGTENGNVFLADPIRGNIRLSYEELLKEGINDKHNKWFVMAIEPSKNKPKGSTLYLSADKLNTHFTVEQSGAITLATVARKNQLMITYNFLTSLGSNLNSERRAFNHSMEARYGLSNNLEIGGSVFYSDYRQKVKSKNDTFVSNSENRFYEIYANEKIAINNSTGIILGARNSFSEYGDTWGGELNFSGYTNTSYAQFVAGTAFDKQISHNNTINNNLLIIKFLHL